MEWLDLKNLGVVGLWLIGVIGAYFVGRKAGINKSIKSDLELLEEANELRKDNSNLTRDELLTWLHEKRKK